MGRRRPFGAIAAWSVRHARAVLVGAALVAVGAAVAATQVDTDAGLGTLVAAHHSAKGQGASLRLCHLGTKFQEVLQITKLMTIFEVFNTEAEAVASFSKP